MHNLIHLNSCKTWNEYLKLRFFICFALMMTENRHMYIRNGQSAIMQCIGATSRSDVQCSALIRPN